MTFKNLGLDSSHAAELALKTEHLLKQRNFPLLQYLLSDTGTIAGFLDALDFNQNIRERSTIHVREVRTRPIKNSINVKLLWEYDLGKCIDATPVIENGYEFIKFYKYFLTSSFLWEKFRSAIQDNDGIFLQLNFSGITFWTICFVIFRWN